MVPQWHRDVGLVERRRWASNMPVPNRERQGPRRRRPRLLRIIQSRPRLFASAALGNLVTLALALVPELRPVTRFLLGWDVGVSVYLVLAAHMMAGSDVHVIRRRAPTQDEGGATILALTVIAALVSLAAIFAHLGSSNASSRTPGRLVFVAVTIWLSWMFIHTMFALHYAHEFYDRHDGGGMAFPGGEKEPDYWDFVYFSFVIGMTSQVSDVGVTSKAIRRTVIAHGVVAFFFNVALLALMINLAAGAI
jgi:uncharacterized membrane protein